MTGVVASLFIPDAYISAPNNKTGLYAFFGLGNIYLVRSADGYFSDRVAFNPFVHTWSLAVEEQFYLLFPLMFYIWLKCRNRANPLRGLSQILLPVIALVSLATAAYETSSDHLRAFYLLPSRFWELASGALLFQLASYRRFGIATPVRCEWAVLFGASMLILGLLVADEVHFPFYWALVPVFGTVLMILGLTGSGEVSPQSMRRLIGSRVMSYIGRISYSLYLWHWGIFSLFRWTIGLTEPLPAALALLLTIVMSAFSYQFVESVFRTNNVFKEQSSWKIIAGGVASIVTVYFVMFILFSNQYRLGLSVTWNSYDWGPYRSEYDSPIGADKSLGKGRKIFVIGDSHAASYMLMANSAAKSFGAEAVVITRSGCPIAELIRAENGNGLCHDAQQDILSQVRETSNVGDIVFLASLRMHRLVSQTSLYDGREVLLRISNPADIAARKLALTQATALVAELQALGLNVLIDAPKPIFRAPPFRCADWFNRSNPICEPGFTISRELLSKLREPVMESLQSLHRLHNVFLWDPFPVLCSGIVCSAFDGKKPVFSDGDHLSNHGQRLLVRSFCEKIEEIWKGRVPVMSQRN